MDKSISNSTSSASIPIARQYYGNNSTALVDTGLIGAFYDAVLNPLSANTTVKETCSTGSCEFGRRYGTLGFCSSCTNIVSSLNVNFYNDSEIRWYVSEIREYGEYVRWNALKMNVSSVDFLSNVVLTVNGLNTIFDTAAVNMTSFDTRQVGGILSVANITGNRTLARLAEGDIRVLESGVLGLGKWVVSNTTGPPLLTTIAISPTKSDQCSECSPYSFQTTLLFPVISLNNSKLAYATRD